MILTLDFFGSRFYVLARSIYWDALSFVKGLLALRILNTRKVLQKLLEALWIYLDVIVMPFAWNWLEEIAKASCIIFWENRFIFRELSIVTLCIGFFFVDDVCSLSLSSVNKSHFGSLILQVEKRGALPSLGVFSCFLLDLARNCN